MIDFVRFEYEPVDSNFVLDWFQKHVTERELVVDYLNESISSKSIMAIDEIAGKVDFVFCEEIGVFPSQVINDLDEEQKVWSESSIAGGRSWGLYKVLWFLVGEWFSEEERTYEVFPLSMESELLRQMQEAAGEDHEEMVDFIYGAETNYLSIDDESSKRFMNMKVLRERVEEGSFYGNGTRDHVVKLVEGDSGDLFVVVEHYGKLEKYLPVATIEDGRIEISKIW